MSEPTRPPTASVPFVGAKIPAISLSSVDLPEPLRPTIPKASPRSTWRSTSRSAQSSRVCGSSRRRMASFSERVGASVILNCRDTPRPTISPGATPVAASELDGNAVLVALHDPQPEQGQHRADDEDVQQQPRAWNRVLQQGGPKALDVRRDRVAVPHQVDQPGVALGRGELLEAVENGREEEPRQEHHREQVLDVAEEDVDDREQPREAQREADESRENRDRERDRACRPRHRDQAGRHEDREHDGGRGQLGQHRRGGDQLAREPDLLHQIRVADQRIRPELYPGLEEAPHRQPGEHEERVVRDVARGAPEHREDERVDAHHRERVDERPGEPERRALVAHPDFPPQEGLEQLAVAGQPVEPRKRPRAGADVDGHAGRILSAIEGHLRIVIDVSPLSVSRTGIGNYVRGLLTGLLEVAGGRHEVVAFGLSGPAGRRRIREALEGVPVELRLPLLPRARWWRSAWSKLGRPPVERIVGPLDVFHFSDWMYPAQRGGARVTTVHDLVPLRFPELVERQTRQMHGPKYENATRTCDLLFADSRFTAAELERVLDVGAERVVVAYPGIDPIFTPEREQADLGGPYVLAVSTLEPRKNLPALVEAFRLLRHKRPDLTLALAGLEGWEQQSLEAEGVRLLGYVPDDELARLYRGAAAFAYSSQFEGFGLPVVEALACGVAAVVSSHPSLDEACGDAAVRADPDDPEAFAEALEQALNRPAELRERGVAHAARFTWRALGETVLGGYESALRD